MIRTIAAIAALIAVPAIAGAQPASAVGEITVYGHSNVYRIVLSTAGKSKREVYHDIAKAANEACSRVNDGDIVTGVRDDTASCVDHARKDAERQYDENRTDWYREVGYGAYRAPIGVVVENAGQ